MSLIINDETRDALEDEIAVLEARLQKAKQRLASTHAHNHYGSSIAPPSPQSSISITQSSQHYLLLLADSALPLGSFAYSSGLESYLTHNKRASSFSYFLSLSVSSYASTTLPFLLAAHRNPSAVADLDDIFDATIVCTVGRRASIAQGKALLSTWERSFAVSGSVAEEARQLLKPFSTLLQASSRNGGDDDMPPPVSAHLAPLFGAIARLTGLTPHQTAYVFMLSHVKALVSAAVRASMFGPFQAQRILASAGVQNLITAMIEREWDTGFEEAGQSVPVIDLWVGRHELIYSRIFNS